VINSTYAEVTFSPRRRCIDDSKGPILVGSIVAGAAAAVIILIIAIIFMKCSPALSGAGNAGAQGNYYNNQPNSNAKLNDGLNDNYEEPAQR